jgi:hypothetical protein
MVKVTTIVLVIPLLFVTATGMSVVTGLSLLNPIAAGVSNIVSVPVVITSAITPAPGKGS